MVLSHICDRKAILTARPIMESGQVPMAQDNSGTIRLLEQNLAALQAGQRLWFWCCPQADAPHPPLLVRSLSQDPSMDLLRQDILRIPQSSDTQEFVGLGSIDSDGILHLGSSQASEEALHALVKWTMQNVEAHPGLARLRNTRMVRLDGERVAEVYQLDEQWSRLPELSLTGTMSDAAQRLAMMEEGSEAWFWLSARGPGSKPILSLMSRVLDAKAFSSSVSNILLRSPRGARGIKGVARIVNGKLILTTTDSIKDWKKIIKSISSDQGTQMPRLAEMGMLQIVDGQIKAAEVLGGTAPKADLSRQAEILSALSEEDRIWFWFAGATKSGGPLLLLETERDRLRPGIKAARAVGTTCKGRMRLSKKGWVEFQTREEYREFIPHLAGWVATHRSTWPAIERLLGSRMIQKGEDGSIVGRFKNDNVWD